MAFPAGGSNAAEAFVKATPYPPSFSTLWQMFSNSYFFWPPVRGCFFTLLWMIYPVPFFNMRTIP
jgi:hypothetical protein